MRNSDLILTKRFRNWSVTSSLGWKSCLHYQTLSRCRNHFRKSLETTAFKLITVVGLESILAFYLCPYFPKTALLLSAGSSGLDECLQSFSHSEDLQFLLQNYKQCRTLYTNSKFIENYSFFYTNHFSATWLDKVY